MRKTRKRTRKGGSWFFSMFSKPEEQPKTTISNEGPSKLNSFSQPHMEVNPVQTSTPNNKSILTTTPSSVSSTSGGTKKRRRKSIRRKKRFV